MNDVDRIIHEPARLMIVALLAGARAADFRFLMRETGLTKGNLSSHLAKLEEAGYVSIEKSFRGKVPFTLASLTRQGLAAFETYRKTMKSVLNPVGNAERNVLKIAVVLR